MGREACRGSAAAMASRIWLVGGELHLCSASVRARKGERPKKMRFGNGGTKNDFDFLYPCFCVF
jgi:hypothetical protein